ncbi:MAG: hypothetical protein I3J02_00190, partial [Prevotella sp.]|nr:hypothetical protein [Prevotella sp.]
MKKIFTLTAMALMTMSVNAQKETYSAVTIDQSTGTVTVNADFGTTDEAGNFTPVKEVTTGTTNVVLHALTSGA